MEVASGLNARLGTARKTTATTRRDDRMTAEVNERETLRGLGLRGGWAEGMMTRSEERNA